MELLQVAVGVVNIARAILVFTRPLSDMLLDAFHRIFMGRHQPLPPIRNKILLMPAVILAERIRKKQISALEVMQIYIDRIKAVQPLVNAYVDERFKDALEDARRVDELIASNLKTEEQLRSETPLFGVPFSCKEIIGVKGLAQTNGMLKFKDRKALEDSDVAVQYKRAGAIPLVVTNIPTMLLWWDTYNPVFGWTRNPYDRYRQCGGSSGGEGALISSAGSVIGLGNDLGGSVRLPAACCGVYGHKPSPGIISNKPHGDFYVDELDPYFTTGPMCRYVNDLALLMRVLVTDQDKKTQLMQKVNFKKVKIYYMETLPGFLHSATADVRDAVKRAVKHFEKNYQATASEIKIDELKYSFQIMQAKFFEVAGPFLRERLTENSGGKLNIPWECIKYLVGRSEYDLRILYFTAIEFRQKDKFFYNCLEMYENIQEKIEKILQEDAILLLPTIPEPPTHSITTIPKFFNIGYMSFFNLLGYPATQIPAGLSGGLPIGIQAAAGKDKDHLTLAAAYELDKVFGGWKSPCDIEI